MALTRLCQDTFQIVSVADQLADRRKMAENEFGARTFSDYRALLKKGGFEVFVNALPTPLHVPATIEALKAGYHVLCEKPMAGTIKDFDRMAEASAQAKRILFPFQNNRFQPFFNKMQEVLQSGVLGEILVIRSSWSGFQRRWDWQTLTKNLGGSLFNTGPHAIDQALTLIGFDKRPTVTCKMECRNTLGGDAENYCMLTLQGKNMPVVEILLSSFLAYPQGDMYNIQGTLGGLTGHATELRWKYYDPRKAPKQKFWKPWSIDRKYPSEQLPWIEDSWKLEVDAEQKTSGYTLRSFSSGPKTLYDNIHDVLRKKGKILVTLPQVRRQIAILEEAHRQNPHIWRGTYAGRR